MNLTELIHAVKTDSEYERLKHLKTSYDAEGVKDRHAVVNRDFYDLCQKAGYKTVHSFTVHRSNA